jgi:hypothetical protein
MKRKHSKPPAASQERVENPLARVSFTEVAPDADRIVQELIKDPAQIPGTVQLLIKYIRRALKRAEASRREAKKVNENRQEKTNRTKQTAHTIIEGLIKKYPYLRLPGKQTKLARCVQARWPKHDKAPAISTLRHWLAEMRPKK